MFFEEKSNENIHSHSWIDKLTKKSEEQKELISFMCNQQNKILQTTYLGAMKKSGWMLVITAFLVFVFHVCLGYGYIKQGLDKILITYMLGTLAFNLFLTFFPEKMHYACP